MAKVFAGRYTASSHEPVALFAIGMRINRIVAVHRWLRPTINTARMWWHMQHARPDGYLSGYLYVYARSVGMQQYWRDFEPLEAFAHSSDQPRGALHSPPRCSPGGDPDGSNTRRSADKLRRATSLTSAIA